jgi:hypothetical protein
VAVAVAVAVAVESVPVAVAVAVAVAVTMSSAATGVAWNAAAEHSTNAAARIGNVFLNFIVPPCSFFIIL